MLENSNTKGKNAETQTNKEEDVCMKGCKRTLLEVDSLAAPAYLRLLRLLERPHLVRPNLGHGALGLRSLSLQSGNACVLRISVKA